MISQSKSLYSDFFNFSYNISVSTPSFLELQPPINKTQPPFYKTQPPFHGLPLVTYEFVKVSFLFSTEENNYQKHVDKQDYYTLKNEGWLPNSKVSLHFPLLSFHTEMLTMIQFILYHLN